MQNYKLQLDYPIVLHVDKNGYFTDDGNRPFDKENKNEMLIMMNQIAKHKNIQSDEYLLKKLEIVLRYELPTFAATRKLVRNWTQENFVF